MTESCTINYCQDGLQVYFASDKQQFTERPIYGHYELQTNDVNGRPYFKMGSYAIWFDGVGFWWISLDYALGQSIGFAYYDKYVFCPHQLSEWNWRGDNWNIAVTCRCIFIQNKI